MAEQEQVIPLSERFPRGAAIVERIRDEVNGPYSYWSEAAENEDTFRTLYLTPRDTAIPDHLLSGGLDLDYDIHTDIAALFRTVVDALRVELQASTPGRERLWLAIEPSVADSSLIVLLTDNRVLMTYWAKASAFHWPSEGTMAETMERWFEEAAARLHHGHH